MSTSATSLHFADEGVLVLGIGNVLWGDEGFGVRAVEALDRSCVCEPAVDIMDGGTQGLYLLPYVKAAHRLVVFDAIDYGLEPGTLKLVCDEDVPRYLGVRKMSLHQSSFQEVLSLAWLSGAGPAEVRLIGVQPQDVSDYGGSLTPRVRAQIAPALVLAANALAGWGIATRARMPADGRGVLDPGVLDIAVYESGRPPVSAAWRAGDARVVHQFLSADER